MRMGHREQVRQLLQMFSLPQHDGKSATQEPPQICLKTKESWWTFRIFFLARGGGRRSLRAPGVVGGIGFFFFKFRRGGGRPGGAERPGGCLQRIGNLGGG